MSETFCILPFIHLEARSDSFIAPCCMSQEFYRKEDGTYYTLSKDTLSEVWNSKSIETLRENLIGGRKPTACESCWKEEDLGKESKRIRENRRWGVDTTPSLKFLDLKLGNTCNLKCRICSPGSSSNWLKEHKDLYGSDVVSSIARMVNSDKRSVMQWPENNPAFWDDLDSHLEKVELFEIYGGEPFLISNHFSVLKKSIDKGYSKNQRIHYNTNGTIFPEDAVNNIWPHFKEVDIMISIDGIEEQFEYQRYPAQWEAVLANIHKFRESFSGDLQICMTVSSLNVYYLPEYLEYFNNIGINVWLNILYHPSVYSVCHLSQRVKEHVIEKLTNNLSLNHDMQAIINYMSSSTDDMQTKFIEKVILHDKYRKQNYFSTFKEFGKLLCEI